ncbi:hypothetical protein B0H66DRAFT_600191 [Apodospora peruviana]|uniref:RING-type domain-containing protein n=1 Tax=Apodospora peruviana TaxID=516989 RepID=A0AAE0MB31_9PEZI|nr:hypothetical protein B0H66DRAFT_600191 [Apodospora peruviana]
MSNNNASSSTAAEETVEETYWPNIERYIAKPSGPKPHVACGICGDELLVPGLQELCVGRCEKMIVLICKHVLGMICLCKCLGKSLTCPFCRTKVPEYYRPLMEALDEIHLSDESEGGGESGESSVES